jgi:uncharacterized protein YbjT (DUF2867 family)
VPPAGRIDCVTGAFGFTGRFIAARLRERGIGVRTLTGHPLPGSAVAGPCDPRRYAFDSPDQLAKELEGVHTLYNTYWVRFERGATRYDTAVRNTRRLFAAARAAGVARVVHVSIANADADSDLPYYRGKGILERELSASGLSHAIVRPTVLFGDDAILIHNIAWLLRRLPVFAIPSRGDYRLQPVHVDDLARLCVELGERGPNAAHDAAGPEIFAYRELVESLRAAVGARALLVSLSGPVCLALARAIGRFRRRPAHPRGAGRAGARSPGLDPVAGLHAAFSDWVWEQRDELGRAYRSELARHFGGREGGG